MRQCKTRRNSTSQGNTIYDNTRQDKPIQYKQIYGTTISDNTRQDETMPNNIKQYNTIHTIQDKTTKYKTQQHKSIQDKTT